jgi:hypothetical protein
MSSASQILRHVQSMRGAVTDGDRTAWKGNAAELGIGVPYIISALLRANLVTAARGVKGYLDVKKAVKGLPDREKDAKGLELFYEKLRASKLGEPVQMYLMAKEYIEGHRVKATWELLTGFSGPRFLASMNGSNVALAAGVVFKFTDFVSNQDLFSGGKLKGVSIRMGNGEDKCREAWNMLSRYGLRLNQCFALGDSVSDIPMLREAGLAIASPFATAEVKGIADYCLEDQSLLDCGVSLRP